MAQQITKTRLSFIEIAIVVVGLPIALIVASMSYHNWNAHTAPGSVLGIPSVSPQQIDYVLCKAQSPACHTGQALYDEAWRADIDGGFALAVFHEGSNYGKLPCNAGTACIAFNKTWPVSYRAWFKEIKGPDFVGSGLTTRDKIIAKMAPPNTNLYAKAVNDDMAMWDKLTLPLE
jgi:hypothetical protein